MIPREHVMAIARGEIGTHEEPWGSNRGKRVQTYQAATWLGGTGWPWCVAFCMWVWKRSGLTVPYPSAGVFDLYRWAQRSGETTSDPKPGDGVCFNIGSGHIGLFVKFEGSDVVTLDGNASDQVKICQRSRSSVLGYVSIASLSDKVEIGDKPAKPKPKPKWVVTTSLSGHKKVHAVWAQSNVGKLLPKLLRNKLIDGITIKRRRAT